jgi:hypothetical protein
VLRIAAGKKDRRKQDALHVRVGRDGRVCSTPQTISEDEARDEFERARRYRGFVDSMLDGKASAHRHDKAMAALKTLFEGERHAADSMPDHGRLPMAGWRKADTRSGASCPPSAHSCYSHLPERRMRNLMLYRAGSSAND